MSVPQTADFVTDDQDQVQERKETISEKEWNRCAKFAKEYRDRYPKSIRNGVPSKSMIPSKPLKAEEKEKKSKTEEKNGES
jgi:hypothetical protein